MDAAFKKGERKRKIVQERKKEREGGKKRGKEREREGGQMETDAEAFLRAEKNRELRVR